MHNHVETMALQVEVETHIGMRCGLKSFKKLSTSDSYPTDVAKMKV